MIKKVFTIFIYFICALPILSQQYEWQVLNGHNMPNPVSGGQVVVDVANNKFYVLGGQNSSNEVVDWIQEYNILTGKWNIVGRMNQPRYLFVADIWKSSILYFGGVSETSQNKGAMESWDYKSIPSEPTIFDIQDNFGRSFSTGHIKNDELFIIGGNPIPSITSELPYIVGYDLSAKRINFTYGTTGPNQPEQQMTILLDNNIYIFGGILNGALSSIKKFDINTKQLEEQKQTLNIPRAGGVAVYNQYLKRGFIIGGYNETNKALKSVEAIYFSSDGKVDVYQFASLKHARRNPMAISYGNTIVVFGGKDENGQVVPYLEKLVQVTSGTDVVDDTNILPKDDRLLQNYPNPFNPSTTISFELSRFSSISLDIYSTLGEHVITLKHGEFNAGRYFTTWDGIDKFGNKVPSGIYFLRLRTDNLIQTRKMVLLK